MVCPNYASEAQVLLTDDYTHPMREDVKQKHLSTPLRGIPVRCLHPGPSLLSGEVLVFALEIAYRLPGDGSASGFPLLRGFMPRSLTPLVAKLHKPAVGISANHHPMRLEAYGFLGLSEGA